VKQSATRLLPLAGLITWGDLGPFTIYKNKQRRVVIFAKTYPGKPPSPLQTHYRDRFKAAIAAWNLLTPGQRSSWHLACARLALPLTGLNLWMHWRLINHRPTITTIENQSGVSLLP